MLKHTHVRNPPLCPPLLSPCNDTQVSLNLNIMVRSATEAVVVLTFMFAANWRLTVVTFILVPIVVLVSRVSAHLHPGACSGAGVAGGWSLSSWCLQWCWCRGRVGFRGRQGV